jgi:hypothetical protein
MSTIAGDTMQRSFRLATRRGDTHWGFAVHTTMGLIVIVLFTLTSAALEALSGDQSPSAIEAASSIVLAHDIYSNLRDRDGNLCCGGQDCGPVEAKVLPNGNYYLPATDEIIPADLAAPSPDNRFHRCVYHPWVNAVDPVFGPWESKPKTRCFFAPMHSS